MSLKRLLLLSAAALVSGSPYRGAAASLEDVFVDQKNPNNAALRQERFLVELAPGETRWVTEEDKLEFLRVRQRSRPDDAR
jgi:hypothetical protein